MEHAFSDDSSVIHGDGPKGEDHLAGLTEGIKLEMLQDGEDHLCGILAHVLAGLVFEIVMGEDVLIAVDEVVKGKDVLLVVALVHQKIAHLAHV